MRLRKIPWRFLLPGVIFPMSILSWVQYYLSVRASDDSPAPGYWFGSPLSAWLNFPAYVYSAPAQPLARFGIRLGKLGVQPRIVMFFSLVIVFWYWVGTKFESLAASKETNSVPASPGRALLVLNVLGATLWMLIAVGTAHDLAFVVEVSRHSRHYIYGDRELLSVTEFLWSVVLAAYYSRGFLRYFKGKSTL